MPDAVVKAVNKDFDKANPLTWGKFPYALKSYAWVVNPDATVKKPNLYEVEIKGNDGSDIYAVYDPNGTIIQSRSIYKDAPLPPQIMKLLENSKYKGWNVVGDKELIKYYKGKSNVEEHFKITVRNGNEKRNISFKYTEPESK